MKKIIMNLILVLTCVGHFSAFAMAEFSKREEVAIVSKILGEQRELVVYLPADYETENKQFPVLYMTDGDIQGPHTNGTLDFLAKFDQTPGMIVVGVVNPRFKRNNELTLTEKQAQKPDVLAGADLFLDFIESEVIPFIEARYRTLQYKALSGTSHGGQFAINALIKRPNLFNGVIAISPSLYWNNNQLLGLAEEALKNQTLKGRLFISIANEEPIMTEPFQKLVELTKQYPSSNFHVSMKTFSEESHDSTTLLGQYYGLKHLFPNWTIPNSPQTLSDLQSIYDARSELLGTTILIPEDRANGYGQWLQYLNRKDDALAMFKWNRQTYAQSLNAHKALIQAYLHFDMADAAKLAFDDAIKTINSLSPEQVEQLKGLLI